MGFKVIDKTGKDVSASFIIDNEGNFMPCYLKFTSFGRKMSKKEMTEYGYTFFFFPL